VGDHPEVERILREGVELGFRTSVSSIRIPAVTEGVLAAMHASGDRSITLAPETGTDELRWKMGKHVPNALLLDKVRLIARAGFTSLKLYFIVGLPEETMEDVRAILDLAAAVHGVFREHAAKSGVMAHLHLGASVLVPKPYTPWQRHAMAPERELREKVSLLKKGVARLPNTSLASLSIRQAVWQTYISRAGTDAAEALERAARGAHLSSLLREYAPRIEPEVFRPMEGDLRWHFLRTG
jgi:radical SAM superfamily enzyme YgiQ (UPF0313 family)